MPDHATSADPAVQRQLDRLAALSPGADILGLERITALLDRLGNPHEQLPPAFHVAGTNGKGSTCAFCARRIEAAGLSAHVYTSPHLVRFNERIRLAGDLIADSALAPLLEEVLDKGGDLGASFFEVTTAAAFLAFARTPADACVIEVGLGGRLDATNVLADPAIVRNRSARDRSSVVPRRHARRDRARKGRDRQARSSAGDSGASSRGRRDGSRCRRGGGCPSTGGGSRLAFRDRPRRPPLS